ncbi:hypothetical protein DINM_022991 [Dirofilaria immitis]|nr:hypothetical protein [Dirofilaria immitis]
MANTTIVEARITMEEDPEILDITGTISEMKMVDSEQSKKLENEAVNVYESENLEILPIDENTNIQQLRSPNGVSLSRPGTPSIYPAYRTIFMHDTRETGEKIKHYPLSRADRKWRHDLYNEADQIPMSDREFAKKYGQTFILKLLQELFSAFRQDMRTKNQIRTRALSNVWNTSHYLTKKHRIRDHEINYQDRRESVRKPGSENRLSSAGNIMNKEHRKNEKLGGGEEAESRFQICNTDHKNTKLEIRFGKRYSTQRPMKSDKT